MTAASPGPIVLWLSSRYENIELAQAALAHVCRQRGIDSEMEHWIGMALGRRSPTRSSTGTGSTRRSGSS